MRRWMRQFMLLSSLVLVAAAMSTGLTGASTGSQITKGMQVYQTRCAACHGADLEGTQGPGLVSDEFAHEWSDLNTLRAFIQKNMPKGRPDLTTEEAVSVAQFIASRNGVQPDGFAYPDFRRLWSVADQPVAAQQVKRSWLWGPEGFAVEWETYSEAPGGKRLVQYFDKTRMEITRIDARERPDYVTNGLLAKELVTGLQQNGDATFQIGRRPAVVNVAGDPDDAQGPVYASFSALTGKVEASQSAVTATIDRAGKIGQSGALGNYTDYVYYVPETGHNIPRVFWDFLNSSGPTNRDGQLQEGPIFDPWYAPVGFPITEAYWARAKVAGQVKDVLVQVFERRVLTYTPGNPEGFQVEMGNVGRHYYAWRYGR